MLRLDIVIIGILAVAVVGSAYELSSDITLSPTSTVDVSGNQKSEIHVGEVTVFSSTISNHSDGTKRFTYLLSILNQNNEVEA